MTHIRKRCMNAQTYGCRNYARDGRIWCDSCWKHYEATQGRFMPKFQEEQLPGPGHFNCSPACVQRRTKPR